MDVEKHSTASLENKSGWLCGKKVSGSAPPAMSVQQLGRSQIFLAVFAVDVSIGMVFHKPRCWQSWSVLQDTFTILDILTIPYSTICFTSSSYWKLIQAF